MASILIVEDDPDVAEALAEVLTRHGHRTRTAPDGFRGLQKVAEEVPALILLDVEMPILDGVGMAKALSIRRRGQRPIPVALISASHRLREIAARLGTPYFLKKPFRIDDAIELVAQMLASPRE